MALTQSSFATSSTSTSTSQQQQSSQPQLSLPPPQTFDILPALHELLARIDHADNTSTLHDGDAELYIDLAPLEPKDLPAEVLAIKAKIRKALRELEKLPDMERSVAEQEEEIRELEERVGRQRDVIKGLGAVGLVEGT